MCIHTYTGFKQALTVPSKFKLAKLSLSSVLFQLQFFIKKCISSPKKRKKIKTCPKNCNIRTEDIKIHFRTMSDKRNCK